MGVDALEPVFQQLITTEYASLTAKGQPITYPVTPYIGDGTLDVTTGLTYPSKADRARRNPKVALLYSDSVGSGLTNPPTALVYGYAAVRDADLQANTDRYVSEALVRLPAAYKGMPPFLLKRMSWYFARIWIEITPTKILWWENGALDQSPQEWHASSSLILPASDPTPKGASPAAWKEAPQDWRASVSHAAREMGAPVLTVVDSDGFPVPFRVDHTQLTPDGFQLEFFNGMPAPATGLASLTFHTHPEVFNGQENLVYVGTIEPNGQFIVERQLGDWSLKGNALTRSISFMTSGRKLAPRLQAEAARRGQRVPVVNLPVKSATVDYTTMLQGNIR
jgi:hypothetical protein